MARIAGTSILKPSEQDITLYLAAQDPVNPDAEPTTWAAVCYKGSVSQTNDRETKTVSGNDDIICVGVTPAAGADLQQSEYGDRIFGFSATLLLKIGAPSYKIIAKAIKGKLSIFAKMVVTDHEGTNTNNYIAHGLVEAAGFSGTPSADSDTDNYAEQPFTFKANKITTEPTYA